MHGGECLTIRVPTFLTLCLVLYSGRPFRDGFALALSLYDIVSGVTRVEPLQTRTEGTGPDFDSCVHSTFAWWRVFTISGKSFASKPPVHDVHDRE